MKKAPRRRRRNALQLDPASPPTPATASPIGPAGGDLGQTYPNPTVVSIANVTTGPAVYPAGDGSLLTNLPSRQIGTTGTFWALITTLDGSGQCTVNPPAGIGCGLYPVAMAADSGGGSAAIGKLRIISFSSDIGGGLGQVVVASDAGSSDFNNNIVIHVLYF